MKISVKECAETLKEKDNILILTHANPDGDTLGSGFALCRALMKIGKICAVINADDIPKKYNYLFDDIVEIKFKPDYVVAVDVATVKLLGGLEEHPQEVINLHTPFWLNDGQYTYQSCIAPQGLPKA